MKVFIVLFFLITSIPLFGQESIRGLISNAGDATQYPFDQLIIFDSSKVYVFESGLTHVVTNSLIKVLNKKGAMDLSVIKAGYDPQTAAVEIRKVTIYKHDGQEISIDTNKTVDYPAPARGIFWGSRERMLEIGRLEPGDAVEIELFRKGFTYALLFDEEEKFIPPMKGHFYDIVEFFGPNPIKRKVYQVSVPIGKNLQYDLMNGNAQCSCYLKEDRLIYTFTIENILPIKSESKMVALQDIGPKLLLSTSPDWTAKSIWFFNVNEDYGSFESSFQIDEKVKEILHGAVNEWDSISRLTHWCADEIRYSGISMGAGEGYTLHKGDMTFTDRCGVCKDKAGMLITMLRAAGFQSYPAMTMAGSRIDYIPADQFNHCVTVVKLRDGQYHLLDPTWVPFVRELWSSAEQQQEYLMGVPEGADLMTTPISPPKNHYIQIDGVSSLQPDGTLKGRISITAEGQSDASIRSLFKYSPPMVWFQNIEREILRIWPQAIVTQAKYNDPIKYLSNPIWIGIDYQIPDFAIVTDTMMIFIPLSAAPIFKSFQGHLNFDTEIKERKYPFKDRCSRQVEIQESIEIPFLKKPIRIPSKIIYNGQIASFDGGYEIRSKVLIFRARSTLSKRIYQNSEWPEFKSVIEKQNLFSEKPVVIGIN